MMIPAVNAGGGGMMGKEMVVAYAKAYGNLYGVISVKKGLEIYNSQNAVMDERDFVAFLPEEMLRGEDIVNPNCDERIRKALERAHQNKPYYIPEKGQLLKYQDPLYYQETPQSAAMHSFLRSHWNLTGSKAKAILAVMEDFIVSGGRMEDLEAFLKQEGLAMLPLKEMEAFISCYVDLVNNTRMPANRGYTPMEIFAIAKGK